MRDEASLRVKVCGVTRPEDARLATELGAWAVGFIFYPASPRWIDPSVAGEIVRDLPPGVRRVGVFVNESVAGILAAVRASGIDTVQLHGSEHPSLGLELSAAGVRYWRALRLREVSDIAQAAAWPEAEMLLVDSFVEGQWGGTGVVSDWTLAQAAATQFPERLILSGGLTDQNLVSAVRATRPAAVDVSSGVEERPGIKSVARMQSFFKAIGRAGDPHAGEAK